MAEQLTVPELEPLIKQLVAVVEEHRRQQDIPVGMSEFIQHTVTDDFAYGEGGVEAKGLTGRRVAERDWTYAGTMLVNQLTATPQFADAVKAFAVVAPQHPSETVASNLVYIVGPKIAGGEIKNEEELIAEVNRFVSAVGIAPTESAAKVELLGFFLENEQIQLPNIVLRRPLRADLEKKISIFSRKTEAVGFPYPGAIAEISCIGDVNEIHKDIPKLVTMLRLFDVGSVDYSVYWYRTGPRTVGAYDTHYPGRHVVPPITYRIATADEPRLQKYWTKIAPIISAKLSERSDAGPKSFIEVAYDRYCDAILRRVSYEERMANTIMGLEALFMIETQELMFRSKLRVARAMAHLNEDPQSVFDRLSDGYEARNSFAHGDSMSSRKKNLQIRKYGDLEILFKSVANYLRKALLGTVMLSRGKESVIKTIDSALIDPRKDNDVAALFGPAADIV